jgi:hypothetical protein
MRSSLVFLVAVLALTSSCAITQSARRIRPQPALEVDGRQRPIRVVIDESIENEYETFSDGSSISDWRFIVRQAYVDALKETFTVLNQGGSDAPVIKVMRATPRWVIRGSTFFAQVDLIARLEVPGDGVVKRVAVVVEGPIAVPAGFRQSGERKVFDDAMASAVDSMVRTSGARLLATEETK